ncbi:ubiquitin-like modifier 1 [Phellopilus nigrolimitatus]|nr:ubiquitin-like modifier 1 [Phellopilus nigrolimitatus]
MTEDQIPLKIEFSGGLELLFSKQRSHRISVPSRVPVNYPGASNESSLVTDTVSEDAMKPVDIAYLIFYLRDNLLEDRVELFMENGTIRPGILVLVNDTDWELEGEGEYHLKADDEIVFISTLHGG